MLDWKGLLLALVIGLIVNYTIGINGIILLFFFLIVAVIVSKTGYYEKIEMEIYEGERGWLNVYSNGLMPVAFSFLASKFGVVPFISSVASAMADKFGSELGVFDDNVYFILNGKKTKPGKSGAVSFLGTFASIAGSALIALAAIPLFRISYVDVLIITISGFIGSIVDSVAGFYEERGVGNKAMSNIMGTLFGGLTSIVLMFIASFI